MKNDLISRQKLLEELNGLEPEGFGKSIAGMVAIRKIQEAPSVDAAPVVHGRWMIAGRGIRACSECNHGIREHMACVNHYCPNCSAKMDGGDYR